MAKEPLEENGQSTEPAKEVQEVQQKIEKIVFNIAGAETNVFRAADGLLSIDKIDKEELQKAISQQMRDDWKEQAEQAKKSLIDATFENIDQAIKTINFVLTSLKEAGLLIDESPLPEPLPEAGSEAPAPQAITVTSRLDKSDFMLDKVNSKMWNLLETDTGAQLRFAVEKANSKKQLNVIYSIDFDEAEKEGLKISKKLDVFDKRVYIAAASLYAYRVDTMTIGQIYNAMGYDGTPGARDREKINNSLSKMQMAHIFIDNKEEADVYKGFEHFKYDGYLLPLERVSRIVNGVFVDGVIHLLKEPPMYTFAKNRNQITTIQRALLQTPLSKTNANLLLEDYLIERIARAKTGKGKNKMLYNTIYDNTGVTTKVQRQRTRAKIAQLLEYYKSTGYIKGYSMSTDGVTIQH